LPGGAGPVNFATLMEAVHPDDREALAIGIKRDRETAPGSHLEFRVLWPDGSVHWMESRSKFVCNDAGKPVRSVGVLADITQRKQYLAALQRANRAFKTLSAAKDSLVRATSECELLREVCGVIVDTGGYRMAVVGYPQNDQEKTIAPKAWAGVEEGYLSELKQTWADNEQGQTPIARAIRSGDAEITRGVRDKPASAPAHKIVAGPRDVSNLAVPLFDGKKVIGAVSIYTAPGDAFDDAEVLLLQELADHLACGIAALRTRAERDRETEPRHSGVRSERLSISR
jgi:transcriptional regulator with GAF, ATPase, and Fis domain